jgi:hypothetical protein
MSAKNKRLSLTELVNRDGCLERIVESKDGQTYIPVPGIPLGAPQVVFVPYEKRQVLLSSEKLARFMEKAAGESPNRFNVPEGTNAFVRNRGAAYTFDQKELSIAVQYYRSLG